MKEGMEYGVHQNALYAFKNISEWRVFKIKAYFKSCKYLELYFKPA